MNETINLFFQTKYPPEAQNLMYRAIGLFAVFNYAEPLGEIVDLISMEGNIEDDTICEGVRGYIERGIEKLLFANRVTLLPEVSLSERCSLLEGVFAFTKIEDPMPYLPWFDGWLSKEEIFARCIGQALSEPYEEFFPMIQWVYEGTIQRFKDYLEDMKIENETIDIVMLKEIRKNLTVYNTAFGDVPIAQSLEEIKPIKGQSFNLYLELFRDEIVIEDEMENTVYALLWLALISSDGYQDPKLLLLEVSKDLFTEPPVIAQFNAMLGVALGAYLPARKAENEKA